MKEPTDLQGLRVLVTRPVGQADALCDRLTAAGARVRRVPVLDIRFLDEEPAVQAGLDQLDQADLLVFTSVNAVEGLKRALARGAWVWPPKGPEIAAIGAATAQRLEAEGMSVTVRPMAPYNSEGLLAHPRLHQVGEQRVVLIAGISGRELIAETLTERGAQVSKLEVYRRERPQNLGASLTAEFSVKPPEVVLVTSVDGLDSLVESTPLEQREALLKLGVVTVSSRVARAAKDRGFSAGVLVADEASDEALVAALQRWRQRNRPTEPDDPPVREQAADAASPEGSEPPPPSRRRWLPGVLLGAFAMTLVAGAVLYAGLVFWLQPRLDALRDALAERIDNAALEQVRADLQASDVLQLARIDNLANEHQAQQGQLARAENALQLAGDDRSALASRMDRIERLATARRVDWIVSEAGYLYRVARARLLYHADIEGSLTALADAEALLDDVGGDGLALRQRVRAAMRAVLDLPVTDRRAMAAELQALSGEVADWVLRIDTPRLEGPASAPDVGPGTGTWERALDRAWQRLTGSLSTMVVVRRQDAPAPLMAPDEEWFLREHIRIQLLTARLAVLEGDQATFDSSLDQALRWTRAYFGGSASIEPVITRLQRLRETVIAPPVLDLDTLDIDGARS